MNTPEISILLIAMIFPSLPAVLLKTSGHILTGADPDIVKLGSGINIRARLDYSVIGGPRNPLRIHKPGTTGLVWNESVLISRLGTTTTQDLGVMYFPFV